MTVTTVSAPERTNIAGFAHRLVHHYFVWQDITAALVRGDRGVTGKAVSLAQARYEGLLDAADALGWVPTQFAAQMIAVDAERDTVAQRGERPIFRAAGSNDPQREWDAAFAQRIVHLLAAA